MKKLAEYQDGYLWQKTEYVLYEDWIETRRKSLVGSRIGVEKVDLKQFRLPRTKCLVTNQFLSFLQGAPGLLGIYLLFIFGESAYTFSAVLYWVLLSLSVFAVFRALVSTKARCYLWHPKNEGLGVAFAVSEIGNKSDLFEAFAEMLDEAIARAGRS